jgi:hypothetical protein
LPLSNIVSQYSASPCIPCSQHSSETGTPLPAWRRIARIWGALYLVIFIKISSDILPRKFYFRIPLVSGGITDGYFENQIIVWKQEDFCLVFGAAPKDLFS